MGEYVEHSRENEKSVDDARDTETLVFEQYKLAVEMADQVSARRATANAFFATIHTALLAVLSAAFVASAGGSGWDSSHAVAGIGVAFGGLVLAAAWFLLLRSYRDLNEAKFKVIQEVEKQLPIALFADEWTNLP